MARQYCASLLQSIHIGVANEIASRCRWCSTGIKETLCGECGPKFKRRMDFIAMDCAKGFLAKHLAHEVERISSKCDTCYGDGRIHEPWGEKMAFSAMVVCADPALGLRLGEVVAVSRRPARFERFETKYHAWLAAACGVPPDARLDLGAHPDDGERWDEAMNNFDSFAFFHIDSINGVLEKRPPDVAALSANHAWQNGVSRAHIGGCVGGVVVALPAPDEEVASTGSVVAIHGATASPRRMYEVFASDVPGVVPGNSVVVLNKGAVCGNEFVHEGRQFARLSKDDILCKGEAVL